MKFLAFKSCEVRQADKQEVFPVLSDTEAYDRIARGVKLKEGVILLCENQTGHRCLNPPLLRGTLKPPLEKGRGIFLPGGWPKPVMTV